MRCWNPKSYNNLVVVVVGVHVAINVVVIMLSLSLSVGTLTVRPVRAFCVNLQAAAPQRQRQRQQYYARQNNLFVTTTTATTNAVVVNTNNNNNFMGRLAFATATATATAARKTRTTTMTRAMTMTMTRTTTTRTMTTTMTTTTRSSSRRNKNPMFPLYASLSSSSDDIDTDNDSDDNDNDKDNDNDILGTPPTSFDNGKSPYMVTTPIYYVNDKPHIGHAYTSIACDVLARFMRLSGRDVFFLSGTDEHGQKVQQTSVEKGFATPLEFCNDVSQNFVDLLKLLYISNDDFIRTTQPSHKEAVQSLWNTLEERGAIYLGSYEGWYSVRDECYYTESELVDGKAPTGAEVTWVVKEPSYFFRLSDYQDRLFDYYERHAEFIGPNSRKNERDTQIKSYQQSHDTK